MTIRKTLLMQFIILLPLLTSLQGYAHEIVYSNHELIRNGDFENDYRSWYSVNCSPSPRAAKDGKFGMYMSGIDGESKYLTFFQNIIVPTKVSDATIQYSYRVRQWDEKNQSAELNVVIGQSRGFDSADFSEIDVKMIEPIKTLYSQRFNATTKWQKARIELDPATIESVEKARDNGHFIFLQFILSPVKSERLDLNVHIDNISMIINGMQKIPELNGMIAYFGLDPQTKRETINLLNPKDNGVKTIWTYPKKKQQYQWKDLKWKPDSSELAFVSDFETPFSPTYTNIYAIQANGKGLRKISNPPLQSQIEAGHYPKIKVTGRIKNNLEAVKGNSSISKIDLWVQGAKKVVSLTLKPNAEVPFEIKNVAVLQKDSDLFEPVVVMHWSNAGCAYGVEYERPIAEISFSKADLGTLKFDGYVCNEGSDVNSIRNISWKGDGSAIGFSMIGGLRKIDPSGQSIFMTEELLPYSDVRWPDHITLSPNDDRFLYYDFDLPSMTNAGLYLASDGGTPELLINDAKSTSAAWLPDGSDFLYVRDAYEDKNIYRYDIKSKSKKRLTYFSNESIETISVAGDGKHLVFELRNTWVTPIQSDLWIMDLDKPSKMWQITRDGHSTHPDWNRTGGKK